MDKKKIMAVVGALASIAVIGGAFAYFSATADTVANKFAVTTESGTIEIDEPEWHEPDEPVLPGKILDKDPYTISKVTYDGWVVMKVTSPKIKGSLNGVAGTYEAFDILDWNTNDYTLLKTEDGENSVVYYYGFKNILAAGQSTTRLFTQIQLNDFDAIDEQQPALTADESGKLNGQIDLDAALIQKIDPSSGENFTGVDAAFATLGEF